MNTRKILLVVLLAVSLAAPAQSPEPFRPPSVPLIAHDPYFSIWSNHDRLTEGPTRHWTGSPQPILGLIRVDGKSLRVIGGPYRNAPEMKQTGLALSPTRTTYTYEDAGIQLTLTFLTPALPQDLDILSRPLTYLEWAVRSNDGRDHSVTGYVDCSPALALNTVDQHAAASRARIANLQVLRVGSREQSVLGKSGDNLRIDWGHFYLVAAGDQVSGSAVGPAQSLREAFVRDGALPASDDLDAAAPILAFALDFGRPAAEPVSRRIMLAYDDVFSIEFLHRRLQPYWRARGMDAPKLLQAAHNDYAALAERCRKFDAELTEELRRAGGPAYARIGVLSYRQTLAAHKLVADIDGTPLYFSKENFSNGCIDTVDVTYPSSPFFLTFNPQLLKGQLVPILEYASLPRWKFAFAPHDLGTYPHANGQVYGGREQGEENQMPVEESGNMLLMLAALARREGDPGLALKYWPVVSRWADYLRQKGLDPENQLCTDDFAGHLAHNANLSLKAILALGAYAQLCEAAGKQADAAVYRGIAGEMARRWQEMADDGDHYRLTFDKPGTWSQKYNLVWDRLLGLNLFPRAVARKEIAYYKSRLNRYGLPLDNRRDYTKLDWEIWTATLADSPQDFAALVAPISRWVNEAPDRVPLTDWYDTVTGKQQGFQARSVVGGVFVKLLAERTRSANQ